MGIHGMSAGLLGSQFVSALSPRQVGLHMEVIPTSAKSPKVQGQSVILIPDESKRDSKPGLQTAGALTGGCSSPTPTHSLFADDELGPWEGQPPAQNLELPW